MAIQLKSCSRYCSDNLPIIIDLPYGGSPV